MSRYCVVVKRAKLMEMPDEAECGLKWSQISNECGLNCLLTYQTDDKQTQFCLSMFDSDVQHALYSLYL